MTKLRRHVPGFSSVADFHLNSSREKWRNITPVIGGAQATEVALEKCGFYEPTRKVAVSELDWDA